MKIDFRIDSLSILDTNFTIAYNVTGNWRFAVAKQRPATAKCGGAKPHKESKPDCGFAEPEPP